MGLLYCVFCAIGKSIDILCFLLDLNFWTVHSLIRLLVTVLSFVKDLPAVLRGALVECWSTALLYALSMVDGLSQGVRMAGHFLEHSVLRVKELLQRAALSGHSAVQQVCEACGVVHSLLLYVLNSASTGLTLGAQSVCSAAVGLCDVAGGALLRAVELTVALPAVIWSGLAGTAALLWTVCCFALEFLGSLSHVFVSVFLLDLCGLVLAVIVVGAAVLYLSPSLARRILWDAGASPIRGRLRGAVRRLRLLVLESTQVVMELQTRLRAAWGGSYVRRRGAGSFDASHRQVTASDRTLGGLGTQRSTSLGMAVPCSSMEGPLQRLSEEDPPADSLLGLLKEQEERKRCVICQDSAKSVLLLPCRHLCLCRGCTQLLLRLPVHQHNCPLCRHMILQTMDVYL